MDRPAKLRSDRSFHGLTITQFLGAYNDNLFKQLILLIAVAMTGKEEGSYQWVAGALFALPFILFSGVAGSLADRYAKSTIVVWMKVLEITVMALGVYAFWIESIPLLMGTLFLMATQSTFFGPAKYGILPEMLEPRNLSRANGVIQMTTFLAIILGTANAGTLLDRYGMDLRLPGLACVAIAVLGTGSALLVRRIPPARPDLDVFANPLGDLVPTLRRIWADRPLLVVMLVYSFFWFVGGVVMPTMNLFGRKLMELDNEDTSKLLVTLSVGIACGFLAGGFLSRGSINLRLTPIGMVGLVVGLAVLSFLATPETVRLAHVTLFALGVSAGLFALPLQTVIQHRPPVGEKGRVIGAMNFVNFLFLFLAAGYQGCGEWGLSLLGLGARWIPFSLAILTAAVGLVSLRPILRLQREL